MEKELSRKEFDDILGKDKASDMLDMVYVEIVDSEEFRKAPLWGTTACLRVIESLGDEDEDEPLWIMIQCAVEKLQNPDGSILPDFQISKLTLTDSVDDFLDKFNEYRMEMERQKAIQDDHQDAQAPH